VEEGEREGERLRESAIDSRALLETMSLDKEALSRAVAQNRELKIQLVELQDGFVRLSQQNMELALELETERFRVSQLTRQLEAASQSQEEEGLGEDKRAEIGIQTSGGERGEEFREEGRCGVEVDTQTTAGEEEDTEMTNHLLHQIQEVEGERESLRLQLEELVIERDSLHEEISRLHSQLTGPPNDRGFLADNEAANDRGSPADTEAANDRGSPADTEAANDRGSPADTEAANQTLDILTALQVNFNALQVGPGFQWVWFESGCGLSKGAVCGGDVGEGGAT
jgi:hypothetical protein